MLLAGLDVEGVLLPEIWVNVAIKTGIEELKLTTRDISDYDVLMKKRLSILKENNLTLSYIQDVIATLDPLPGAPEFLEWLRGQCTVVLLSDTFIEFAAPLMKKLNMPALFCHSLKVDQNSNILDYQLRLQDHKRKSIKAFKRLNFDTVAVGDSYNDTTMLGEADNGILFCPPQNVIDEFPQFPVSTSHDDLKNKIQTILNKVEE